MKKIVFLTLLSFLWVNAYTQSGCVDIKIRNSITNTTGDFTLSCNDSCVILRADVAATGITADDYTVESIPFNPPYAFNTGTPIMIGQDDIWNGPTNLPFDFCYYGGIYDKVSVGSNGLVSFDLYAASAYCIYAFGTTPIPTPGFGHKNAIYGVYEDIHPADAGIVYTYCAVLGTYPCRTFVVNWNDVPLYNHQYNKRSTYQIVLYENSNIIDVYVLKRSCCSSTNGGNGIIGIQDGNGIRGLTPPGRNIGTWTTEQEAWRFKPVGDPQYTLYWKDEFNNIVGVGDSLVVCPSRSTRYSAAFEYESCNGDYIEMEANVNITVDTVENTAEITATYDTVCHNQTIALTVTGGNRYKWDTGETTPSISVTPNGEVTYSVRAFRNHCHSDTSKTIYLFDPSITVEGSVICFGETGTVTITESDDPPSGGPNTYLWSDGGTGLVLSASPTTTTTYSLTCTNARGCQSVAMADIEVRPLPVFTITESTVCKNTEGTLSVSGSDYSYLWSNGTTGNVLTARMETTDVTYSVTVTDTSGCVYVDSATIHVYPDFTITTVGSEVCKGETGTVTVLGTDAYVWSDGTTGDVLTAVAHNNTTYTVTGTDINGCPNTATGTIRVRKNPVANFMASSYKVQNDAPPVNFYDQSMGDPVIWDWNFGDGHQSVEQNPTNQYTEEGFYTVWLRVEDAYGCSDSISRQMRIIPPFSFYVPNSFSPDGDGINEVFRPVGEGAVEGSYEMLIHDRWGKLIFRSNTPYDGWDGKDASGKLLPMGMYVYTVQLLTPEDEYKTYQGEVMLVR